MRWKVVGAIAADHLDFGLWEQTFSSKFDGG
jgi:hypothetical protein